MKILRIDHVQLAIPPGGEAAARRFYGEVLGLVEVPKPEDMRARGGMWFEGGIHLGIEEGMRPSAKMHPALVVDDLEAVKRGSSRRAASGAMPVIYPECDAATRAIRSAIASSSASDVTGVNRHHA